MSTSAAAINLLPGEAIVMTSRNDLITLTNLRIRYSARELGSSSLISITLKAVASCGLITRSFPIFLVLAGLATTIGFVIDDASQEKLYIFIAIAVTLTLMYFGTRRAVISISSTGGQAIVVLAKGMKRSEIVSLIEAIEGQ